jgi:hypothetical protein
VALFLGRFKKNNGRRILFLATIIVVKNNIVAETGALSNRITADFLEFSK